MSNPTTAPALNMKALLKVMARQTLGRVPVIGFLSRKAWGGVRKLKHRVRYGNPHGYAALAAADAAAAARAVQSAHATQAAQHERAFQELHAVLVEKIRDVAQLGQTTHALLTEVRDGAFNRLDNNLREQWKVKDAVIAAFAETGGIVADTNQRVQAALASQANQLQQSQVEQRGLLAEGLKGLTDTVENFDGQILQLHDHHASCYLRLADAAEDTAASVRQLTTAAGLVAMDIRERIPALAEGGEYPAPVVPDPDALEERKRKSNGAIRLNLGCGEKPLPDYINCDGRALADVLVIADVRALPFTDGTVDEIASAHLVEHFRQHHLETVILPYWKKLLKPGGTLRVICPNWESMIRRVNRGEMSMVDFKHVTFGGQDYQGDDHFSMYTPQSLGELLERAGFRSPTVIVVDRMNGLCPEMEVTATAS
ncbi:class I SAM-dependent methyltransferase [Limnoglobus roseus]|uniref:Methyltransferase n=1 Tax=Limnoglobus roseus TaxID=2598579 RepID=A0A5C1AGM8_9BACT|nr:methyltransferase domain-containing protein [Limnoglobus roseus]QEL17136.1 methyltransferase [Limnoglobus roseus]